MASVIDAFLVSFGLDPRGYVKGANEVKKADADLRAKVRDADREQRKRDKESEERQKKAAEGYKKIRNEVIGLFAVFTAGRGLKNFIADTVNEAANLGYLSANLRMTAQDLTAWQHASERAGGSAEGITQQLKESADTLAQLKSGLGPTGGLQWFFRMGGSSSDLKDGNSYLLARSKIVHDLFKQDPAQAALVARNMGISEDQFDFIKQGPAAIMALVEAQRKNSAITDKDTAAAKELRNEYLNLTQSLQATAVKLLVALLPAFSKFIVMIEGVTSKLTDNKQVVAEWAEKFVNFDWAGVSRDAKNFAGDIKSITDNVRELIDWWGRWTNKDGKIPSSAADISDVIGRNTLDTDEAKADAKERKSAPKGAHGEPVQSIPMMLKELAARTLASMGSKDAGAYIRDTTGKDDYLVGPKTDPKAATGARGVRNNNPGNIEYGDFARRNGASGSDGRFAKFGSAQGGLDAMATLLRSYGSRGINSIEAIVSKYAPGKENNTKAYVAAIAKATGLNAKTALDMNDPAVLQSVMSAMIQHENGANPYTQSMLKRASGYMPTANGQAQATQMARSPAAAGRTSTTTVTNNIEKVEINTQATDAAGIARDIRPELGKLTFPNQASSGVRQ